MYFFNLYIYIFLFINVCNINEFLSNFDSFVDQQCSFENILWEKREKNLCLFILMLIYRKYCLFSNKNKNIFNISYPNGN